MSSLLSMMIGFTTEWHLSPGRSILDPELESDCFLIFMVVLSEEIAEVRVMITLELRSSDGVFSSWRSRNTSRRIRREMVLRSMPESSLMREGELLTESLLKPSRTENDCKVHLTSFLSQLISISSQ